MRCFQKVGGLKFGVFFALVFSCFLSFGLSLDTYAETWSTTFSKDNLEDNPYWSSVDCISSANCDSQYLYVYRSPNAVNEIPLPRDFENPFSFEPNYVKIDCVFTTVDVRQNLPSVPAVLILRTFTTTNSTSWISRFSSFYVYPPFSADYDSTFKTFSYVYPIPKPSVDSKFTNSIIFTDSYGLSFTSPSTNARASVLYNAFMGTSSTPGFLESITFTFSDEPFSLNCSECEQCQECSECPSGGGNCNYNEKFDGVITAIYTCGAVILVIYFFYCIYRMIITSTGGR